jgi:hypothetical protein
MAALERHAQAVALERVAVTTTLEVVMGHDEGPLRMVALELVAGVDRMHDSDDEPSSRLEHARRLTHRSGHVVDVLERHERNCEVGMAVGEGETCRVREDVLAFGAGGACRLHQCRRGVDADRPVAGSL